MSGKVAGAQLTAWEVTSRDATAAALKDVQIVIAAGTAGVELVPADLWQASPALRVAIDLNAVPPLGIGGVKATARGLEQGSVICYGALGVGGLKMKIHKAAIAQLFARNDQVLDADEVFALGGRLAS